MMNIIWASIFLISFAYACFVGSLTEFGTALVESSNDAVTFVIGLAGVMAMWSGIMNIAEKSGLMDSISRLLLPITKLLFPKQKNPEILSSIVMSFVSNIFGAGNSSTVFSLRTMERLDAQNRGSSRASNDMCTFAVVNMAFAPIVPVVTVQLRQELGSAAPFSTVLPSILTAGCTLIVSIVLCKIMERRW